MVSELLCGGEEVALRLKAHFTLSQELELSGSPLPVTSVAGKYGALGFPGHLCSSVHAGTLKHTCNAHTHSHK